MKLPFFSICSASSTLKAELGSNPVRVFPAGNAPQDVVAPYVVYQRISAQPYNNLSGWSGMDAVQVQVDVYATTELQASEIGQMIRQLIDEHAYVIRLGGVTREPDTRLYRNSFDLDWHITE